MNTNMNIPQDILCPISQCHYYVASAEQNTEIFNDHLDFALNRLRQGKELAFCIHCQSLSYDHDSKSITFIQLAECFDSSFFELNEIDEQMSIQLKDGMILSSPFTKEMTEKLTLLFTHNNIKIIVYDMFLEIPILLKEGINVNINKVIDAAYAKFNPDTEDINQIRTPLIFKHSFSINCIESAIAKKKRYADTFAYFNQNILHYNLYQTSNPFEKINQKFYKLFSKYCAYVSIILFSSIERNTLTAVKKLTSEKVKAFNELIEKFGVFAPCAKRDLAINTFLLSIGKMKSRKIAFRMWSFCQTVLLNFDVYEQVGLGEMGVTRENVEEFREEAEKMINRKIEDEEEDRSDDEDGERKKEKRGPLGREKKVSRMKKEPEVSDDDDFSDDGDASAGGKNIQKEMRGPLGRKKKGPHMKKEREVSDDDSSDDDNLSAGGKNIQKRRSEPLGREKKGPHMKKTPEVSDDDDFSDDDASAGGRKIRKVSSGRIADDSDSGEAPISGGLFRDKRQRAKRQKAGFVHEVPDRKKLQKGPSCPAGSKMKAHLPRMEASDDSDDELIVPVRKSLKKGPADRKYKHIDSDDDF